jgi:hypothetical protein
MKKLVVQHKRSGPWRSSTVSRMELRRTSSASQVNSRCDLWRISPWSGPPVRRSNASSRLRSAAASVSDMMRIGKTQPSSRYCSIWAGVRHFGIDPRKIAGKARTGSLPLPGQNDHGQSFLAYVRQGERGREGLDESDNDRTRDLGIPLVGDVRPRQQAKNALYYGISARKISGLNAAIASLALNRREPSARGIV